MDQGSWGIVAVLVVGTAVVVYGWLTDRLATRRHRELLASPPERVIPRFRPDEPRPRYLSELEAAVRPHTMPAPDLADDARAALARRIATASSIRAGWAANGFVTDARSGWAVLHDPLILVCADGPNTLRELLPALKAARTSSRPLVVVAPDAADDVVATLQANNVQGTLACLFVRLPSAEQRGRLCSLAGGQLVGSDDLRSDWLLSGHLGGCETWVSSRTASWVLKPQPSSDTQDPQQSSSSP